MTNVITKPSDITIDMVREAFKRAFVVQEIDCGDGYGVRPMYHPKEKKKRLSEPKAHDV